MGKSSWLFSLPLLHFHSCVYNRKELPFSYPCTYINGEFRRFFSQWMPLSSVSTVLPLLGDENQFFICRQKLLAQPTAKQTQVAKSATTVRAINDEQSHAQQNVGQTETARQRSAVTMTEVQWNNDKFKNNIFIHCKHEARLEGLKKYIHEIHDGLFKNTSHGDIRLIVGNRNNPNMEYELTRKRPHSSLLKGPSNTGQDSSDRTPSAFLFLFS